MRSATMLAHAESGTREMADTFPFSHFHFLFFRSQFFIIKFLSFFIFYFCEGVAGCWLDEGLGRCIGGA